METFEIKETSYVLILILITIIKSKNRKDFLEPGAKWVKLPEALGCNLLHTVFTNSALFVVGSFYW